MAEGKKFDTQKLRWNLLPKQALAGAVRVLQYGDDKYNADGSAPANWRYVDNPLVRYGNALDRHWVECCPETDAARMWARDPESGLLHLDQVMVNAIFIRWHMDQIKPEEK